MPSLMDDDEFLTELEKIETEPARTPRTPRTTRTTRTEPAGFWVQGARTERYVTGAAVEAVEDDVAADEQVQEDLKEDVEKDVEQLDAVWSSDASRAMHAFHARPSARGGSAHRQVVAHTAGRTGHQQPAPSARQLPKEQKPEPQGVSATVVALVLLVCAGLGAATAAFLFLERASQIAVLWLGAVR